MKRLSLVVLIAGCPGSEPEPEPEPVWEITQELDASSGALLSVWGTSPSDVTAVGGQIASLGDPGVGVMLRRGDDGWSPVGLPADTPLLNWVHGSGGTWWAVGNAGAALRSDDGSTWTRVDAPVDVPLWGVFVLSPDEAWAVGGDAFDFDTDGIIVHFTGGAWEEVAVPMLDRPSAAFFKVWASGPSDVHAVGDAGVILRYDGAAWSQSASGTSDDLISLWGTGPNDITAVGGRSGGAIVHYNGSAWTATQAPMIPGLNGVWVDAAGDAILAGNRGTVATLAAGTTDAVIQETDPRFDVLHAAFGFETGEQYIVGGTLEGSPPWTGVIYELR